MGVGEKKEWFDAGGGSRRQFRRVREQLAEV
jgi:hypothetical protein